MIYIRVDANQSRGMGHLYRMLTLADKLASHKQPVKFVLRNSDVAKNILDARSVDYLLFPASMNEEKIIKMSLKGQEPLPDLWIFDLLDTDIKWIRSINKNNIKVVCFDDTKGALEEADLVINAFVHSWGKYKTKDIRVPILEGLAYAIINPNAIVHRKKRVIMKGRPLAIAITMGGSDTHGSSLVVLNALSKLKLENYSFHLFTGPNFLHQKELSSLLDSLSFKITVKHAVSNLHRALNPIDIVICSGGVTLFEVCAMGLPALAFANEPHEEKNISYLSSLNGCLPIGSIVNVDTKELEVKIKRFLSNSDLLNETAASAMHCVGDSTNNCVQAILNFL